jgi:hypothetical protein
MNVDENLTTTDINAMEDDAAPAPKVRNYQDKDGNIYEYVSAVSEEDAKKGKAVGDVSLFSFRGVFQGRYRISAVDNDGRTLWDYDCSNPCHVIKEYRQGRITDRVAYNPASIIGAVFEDAFNGFLEVSKERRIPPSPSADGAVPHYAPPTNSAPANSEETDSDSNGL